MSPDEPIRDPLGRRIAVRLPDLLTVAAALVLWRLFFPALMSADTMTQYGQALTRQYTDWHPVFMSVVLSLVLGLGGTVGLFMLFQCLAGAFGVRALVTGCLVRLYGGRIPPRRAEWLSALALLLLLLPATPLAFYLMTLWKDVWALVILLWLVTALLRLGDPGRPRDLLLVLGLAVALGLVRHNAFLVLPVVGWVLAAHGLRSGRVGKLGAAALLLAPLLAWWASEALLARALHVRAAKLERVIMALDLVGVCAEDAAECRQLPFTRGHIVDPGFAARYPAGDAVVLLHGEPPLVDPSLYDETALGPLKTEYTRAALRFPLTLTEVKLKAFAQLLGVRETSYFFHDTVVENPYGFVLNRRFERPRQALSRLTRGVAASGWRWLSGVHLVWIAANVLWIAALVVRYRRTREARYLILAQALLLPLGFYLSYLPAAPAHDFRFMYPATLVVQGVTLAGLLGGMTGRPAQKPSGREP